MHEEDVVFPYVLAVDEIIKTENISDDNKKLFEEFSIEEYEEGHDDVEEKLMDLENNGIWENAAKGKLPVDADVKTNAFVFKLR